ncbi:MAG: ABC-type transport system, multidrug-familyATP-binding protein [Clostridiales bacterium]|nr:ABC-type transport system, multidrug-familyATP-binding protein [Clostridiales bacterium]
MKSRLNFIKALIHNPDILFLDEPTSGLDPSNSKDMKDIILEEKKKGKTIILTTHNMVDATELCDRVAFIVDGLSIHSSEPTLNDIFMEVTGRVLQ